MAAKVIEQAEEMRHQIDHHLDRARVSAGIAVVGAVTETRPVIEALTRAMDKVHADRKIRIDLKADETSFRGEKQDLGAGDGRSQEEGRCGGSLAHCRRR